MKGYVMIHFLNHIPPLLMVIWCYKFDDDLNLLLRVNKILIRNTTEV